MIMLADMPEIETKDIKAIMVAAADGKTVQAVDQDGRFGHPVVFPARLFPALLHLEGDVGAREVLQGEDITALPLPGYRATTDLDTPEDWGAWRAKTGNLKRGFSDQ